MPSTPLTTPRMQLRAADSDRRAAADRLLAEFEAGRLDLLEYDDRLARAYAAVTYADLEQLCADLPPASAMVEPVAPSRPAPLPPPRPAPSAVHLPTALKVLWTMWAAVVAINLTVWVLVSVGNGEPDYFWPMWLAVPGAALFAVSAAVVASRQPPH